jgi:hypothetical protein
MLANWVPGTVLAVAVVAAIVVMALPVQVLEFARYATAVERPFVVPERSIPIPVDPALVYPGWCQPATTPICQEV